MNLAELAQRLLADHHHDPQACQTIVTSLGEIERGLGLLAKLGHVFHLENGPAYDLPQWPRVLFHVESAPNGRVVNSWWEADELGPGWWPTYSEAAHREGVRYQFAGRGGIGGRSLPMLVDGGPAGPRPDAIREPNDNSAVIDQWKRSIEGVRDRAWGNTNIISGNDEEPGGNGNGSVSTESGESESVSGVDGLGSGRSGGNGSEAGVRDPATRVSGGIS